MPPPYPRSTATAVCRGLRPENTLEAFRKAVDVGCDWLEMDVVLTGDGQVLISHEPWMDHRICRTPEGDSIDPAQERGFNIFRMTVEEAQRFDCGSAPQPDFPEQDLKPSAKPTLREVVEAVDEHALLTGSRLSSFNIEIKSEPALYGTFQPEPSSYVKAVLTSMDSLGIADRCILQSFDPAILEALHAADPSIPLAFLVEKSEGLEQDLGRLSFAPAIYSPAFEFANAALLAELRGRDMQLVVWTVNEEADIARMLDLGVDGIISDYPDRVIRMLDDR
ncbi:MAG: glycerophosphodiester phosphodiesterase [Flavobacteriales bacterium]|nr:glycerophosphodiester phosphodiesterase [Flavobacteriales bacterium]